MSERRNYQYQAVIRLEDVTPEEERLIRQALVGADIQVRIPNLYEASVEWLSDDPGVE